MKGSNRDGMEPVSASANSGLLATNWLMAFQRINDTEYEFSAS